jgi:hypothetical protein
MSPRVAAILPALWLLAACRSVAPAEAPIITPDRDVTYPDGRPIADPRFAAALVMPDGETRLFDDIGRLVIHAVNETGAAAWVYDYDTAAPIPAADAHFVAARDTVTPRGSGLLAVGSAERAEQLARETGGRVLAWADLPAYLQAAAEAPPPAPPPSGDDTLEADGLR